MSVLSPHFEGLRNCSSFPEMESWLIDNIITPDIRDATFSGGYDVVRQKFVGRIELVFRGRLMQGISCLDKSGIVTSYLMGHSREITQTETGLIETNSVKMTFEMSPSVFEKLAVFDRLSDPEKYED